MGKQLPIDAVLPDLKRALAGEGAAVLVAPPGAGKTTALAPRLLDQDWCTGQIWLTAPRRLAARAAAERMAQIMGEKPGQSVGYLTRLDTRQSPETRILVMTEAIFVNRIIEDPELSGVSAVFFDEAHERHLDSDLGLALAIEARSALRDDLRLLVMSATIDGARFADLLGEGACVIESAGRSHPLRIEWLGSAPHMPVEEAMAQAIGTAWRAEQGDILAFLPGIAEIERTRERLQERLGEALILALHGQIDPAGQRAAIMKDAAGRRRIVLASAIAETSLTLDGVSVVVDSGLARTSRFDRAAGTSRLVTERASQAAARQRAGRAARQSSGVAYRLWEEAGHSARPAFALPEIETGDLAPLLLKCARWGTRDPHKLAFLDPPPDAALNAARKTLETMGAIDTQGAILPWGKQIASLPLDPAYAASVLFGARCGQAEEASRMVLLLQERGLGGGGADLNARLEAWDRDHSKRAVAARRLAKGWADQARRLIAQESHGERHQEQNREPHREAHQDLHQKPHQEHINPALFLAQARPDFLARSRGGDGAHWLCAGGRGFTLDPASSLSRAEWLVIGDAVGSAKGARITAAAALTRQDVERHLASRIQTRSVLDWNEAGLRVEARLEKRLGAITLSSGPDPALDPEAVAQLLLERAQEHVERLLPASLIARGGFARIEELSLAHLRKAASLWLAPLLEGRFDLDLPQSRFAEAALAQLSWEARASLDRYAPRIFVSPAESEHVIDYTSDDAPSIEVRAQALFGLEKHPLIGAGDTAQPLLFKITSPAGRPIQSTRDISGFWRGSWAQVRKEMKGRYPKHRWPEEPWAAIPSLRTKRSFADGAK